MTNPALDLPRVAADAAHAFAFRSDRVKRVSGRSGPWMLAVALTVAGSFVSTASETRELGFSVALVFAAVMALALWLWSRADDTALQRSYVSACLAAPALWFGVAIDLASGRHVVAASVFASAWFVAAWLAYMMGKTRRKA
jgi:hypothetical protein